MIKQWQQLEQWICEKLKPIDPFIKRTPGSGNGNCKGDIYFRTNVGLHIEAKWRNIKNVFNLDWLNKCSEEIPLHSDKIPLLITENKDGKKLAILNADDFIDIYVELHNLRNNR